ncbi:MAG: acyl carrier protein [Thermoanaerobaculia bacterium]
MDRKEIVLEVLARVSGVERRSIGSESELVGDLGIDSPRALAMLVELEDRLETEIDDKLVTRLNTVADVLRAIGQPG